MVWGGTVKGRDGSIPLKTCKTALAKSPQELDHCIRILVSESALMIHEMRQVGEGRAMQRKGVYMQIGATGGGTDWKLLYIGSNCRHAYLDICHM
jgi:hypothetical protein